jgi:hypothetical protein
VLENNKGVGLLEIDHITEEGAPYNFKPQHPLDEATALPSHFTPVRLVLAMNNMDGWD